MCWIGFYSSVPCGERCPHWWRGHGSHWQSWMQPDWTQTHSDHTGVPHSQRSAFLCINDITLTLGTSSLTLRTNFHFWLLKLFIFEKKGWRILDSISLYRESLDSTSLFWELYPSVADFCGENKEFVCFMGSLWLATSLVIEFLNRWDYAAKRTFGVFRPIWRNLCQIWQ